MCHDGLDPGGGKQQWQSTNKRWAGLWRPAKAKLLLFQRIKRLKAQLFIAHSDAGCERNGSYIVPGGTCDILGFKSVCEPGKSAVAGLGEVGPGGPRTGNSSGVCPGNSSGRAGAPGSRIGGGTSGCGFPGGLSCGGSVGCPGLIGGSSSGSIPIYIATLALSVPWAVLSLAMS